jgi:squalene-associated FAD-dependent desaturase
MPERRPVIIVGGGWAGLAAAVELCAHEIPVKVLESAQQLGGRARSICTGDMIYDNGQHLFIGAYRSVLSLMEKIGVDCDKTFLRQPLTLRLIKGNRTNLHFKIPRLPAPFHLLSAILTARGLSTTDRIQALRFGRRLPELSIAEHQDISVEALMHSEAQTPALIKKVWGPLCIAALNTPLGEASARIFVNVLRESLLGLRRYSDFLIPRLALGEVLPAPCAYYLEQRGVRLELGQRVTSLEIGDACIQAVKINERRIDASHVVLAAPHSISRRLMSRHQSLQALCSQLSELDNEPVITLYLQYPPQTRLPQPVVGLVDTLTQWVFDRRVCGQPGMMAVVISAKGSHSQMKTDELTKTVAAELATSFPDWPVHGQSLLIHEKRATISSRVGVDQVRPGNKTPVSGLWLAGDYTANGLPATLEGAVRSGIGCAQAILGNQ